MPDAARLEATKNESAIQKVTLLLCLLTNMPTTYFDFYQAFSLKETLLSLERHFPTEGA